MRVDLSEVNETTLVPFTVNNLKRFKLRGVKIILTLLTYAAPATVIKSLVTRLYQSPYAL